MSSTSDCANAADAVGNSLACRPTKCSPWCFPCRERDAAAVAAQQTLSNQLLHDPPHAYVAHVAHITVALDDLLSAAQATVNKHAGAAAIRAVMSSGKIKRSGSMQQFGWQGGLSHADTDVSWVCGAMMRLKELLLESQR